MYTRAARALHWITAVLLLVLFGLGVSMTRWDLEADVLIVGGGATGLAATRSAAQNGTRAAALDAAVELDGTTRRSGGAFWIPTTPSCDPGSPPSDGPPIDLVAQI